MGTPISYAVRTASEKKRKSKIPAFFKLAIRIFFKKMTRSCKWGNCNNSDHKSPTLRFIPFAKPFGKHADVKRAQKWVDLCARKDFSVKSINNDSYICAHHFPNYETKEELTPQTNKELEPYSFLA